jgi:membrane protease YdiL (CAAX protease family)
MATFEQCLANFYFPLFFLLKLILQQKYSTNFIAYNYNIRFDKNNIMEHKFGINNKTIFAQLLIFIGTTMLCFSVFAGIGQLWLNAKLGAENVNLFLQYPLQHLQFINAFKWVQLFSSIGMFGLSAILISFLKNKNGFTYLKINELPKLHSISFVLPLVIFSLPIIAYLYYYNQQVHFGALDKWLRDVEHQNSEITKAMLSSTTIAGLLFNLIVIAIVPGMVEELFFRGALQNLLHEGFKNKHIAIWTSAIIFSAVHMEFLGFVPRLLMGAMLGYLYVYTENIWVNILAHLLNNGISVVAYFLYINGFTTTDIDKVEHYGILPTMAAVVLFTTTFYYFYKKNVAQKRELN